MSNATTTKPLSAATHTAVVELRQYTLKPDQRDVLMDIFERHFVEAQEAAGAKVIGHFCDLDDPDRFVWLRGFRDMPSRRSALETFYESDIWKTNRTAVNETLVDYENVLLLRPARQGSGFQDAERPRGEAGQDRNGLVAATICSFDSPVSDEFVAFFLDELEPKLVAAGARAAAALVTDPSENTFPALAIREGENVFVWIASFPDEAAYEAHLRLLEHELDAPVEMLRLAPAARSELR